MMGKRVYVGEHGRFFGPAMRQEGILKRLLQLHVLAYNHILVRERNPVPRRHGKQIIRRLFGNVQNSRASRLLFAGVAWGRNWGYQLFQVRNQRAHSLIKVLPLGGRASRGVYLFEKRPESNMRFRIKDHDGERPRVFQARSLQ
jgi:hypothetical protein